MWFLLFSSGALLLAAVGLPAARRLPVAPPPEALVACYFLVATLLRLVVRNARLAAFERKARREARRKEDGKAPSVLGELGLGVGRGALQVVAGDVLGAGLSLVTALLRGAASTVSAPVPPTRERRRAARWERLKAVSCIAGVGLVCAGIAWEPLVRSRLRRAADAAVQAATETPGARPGASATARAAGPPPAPPAAPAPSVPAVAASAAAVGPPAAPPAAPAAAAEREAAPAPASAPAPTADPAPAPAPAAPPP
jgi:hypothetical protein